MLSKTSHKTDANPRLIRRHLKVAYLLVLISALTLVFVYAFQSFYPDSIYTFSNVFPPFVPGFAVLSSFFALLRYWESIRSRMSMIWLCFSLGMLLWFFGELGWAFYTMVLNIDVPYPSIADVFWLSGYVPLFIALLLYIQIIQPAISLRLFSFAAVIVTVGTVIVFSLLMVPVLGGASQEDFVKLSIDLAYPTLDLALSLETILGLLVFTVTRLKARIGVAWHIMNAAILSNVVADMAFSYTNLESVNAYYNGHPLELLYHVGYLLFALAFFVHSREL